ncbi:MAG: hypothetical protein JNJ61_05925 [Anaerolineae bacterium]|nr:hypothetical protein [Anaerolineae bacterium]
MATKNPKCLVIDTSVMLAAGGVDAVHPTPKLCRDFLNEVLKLGHIIIMTDDLFAEWNRHGLPTKSLLGKSPSWYVMMERKGRVRRVLGNTVRPELRQAVFAVLEANAQETVNKDMHLIEAALLADEIVVSKEVKVRKHFRNAALRLAELQVIVWVNPAVPEEGCITWLRAGAPAEIERLVMNFKERETDDSTE